MRSGISTIFMVCLGITLNAQNAFSAECQDHTDRATCEANGCVFADSRGCLPCMANQYRAPKSGGGYECKDCTNGPSDPAGKACGADGAMCQYTGNNGDSPSCRWTMTCGDKPGFQNGTWAPDATTITYDGTGTPPSCAYTNANNITCDASGAPTCSNHGFHLSGTSVSTYSCVSNVSNTGCTGDSLKFYTGSGFSECYVKNCQNSNYQFIPKQTCGSIQYGICKSTTISCDSGDAQSNGLDRSKCVGTISGDARYDNNTYDFSTCTCVFNIANFANGTATRTCNFTSNGDNITACSTEINSCDTGFCSANNTTCDNIPAGYYSVGTAVECTKCPYGATSDGGTNASGASSCYWNANTTFTDSVGAFRLPVPTDGKIIMQIN